MWIQAELQPNRSHSSTGQFADRLFGVLNVKVNQPLSFDNTTVDHPDVHACRIVCGRPFRCRKTLAAMARIWPAAWVTLLVLGGCSQGVATAKPVASTPVLKAGQSCPVSPSRPGSQLSSQFGTGPAFGIGPVYALTVDPEFTHREGDGGWAGVKVMWIRGPQTADVTITGTRLDGYGEARFGQAVVPSRHMTLVHTSDWRGYPSTLRSQSEHGCFAFSIAGVNEPDIVVDFGA